MKMTKRITTFLTLIFVSWSLLGQDNESAATQEEAPAVPINTPSPEDLDKMFSDTDAASAAAAEAAAATEPTGDSSDLGSSLALEATDAISVDFPNEEIRTVLRNVADLYMLNLVVPETLQGTTSIKLRDVNWRQIFSVVLDPVGFTYIEEGNIIKVVSKDTLNFEPPVTEIFALNYANAGSIAATLGSMIDQERGGRIQVDNRTNSLIVTEQLSKIGTLRDVVKRLDKPTEQVLIETRFIEVTNRDIKNIGVNWTSLRNYGVSAGGLTRTYSKGTDQLRSGTSDSDTTGLTNQADASFDIGGASVSGEPGIINGRLIDNLTGATLLDATSDVTSNVTQSTINNLTSLVNNNATNRVTSAVFSADEFGFVISALKEQDDSRLVSNPTIVTLNNQAAEISIGEQFPIPNYQYNEERGSFEVSGFEYKDIGVILKVKPSVNNAGLITLNVVPEVSSKTGETEFGGASSAAIPIIATRRTQTQIALKDGYTMGIGGLIQNRDLSGETKVPVLGNIPGLGRLFRHQSKDQTQLNLLIFITAKILPSEDADFEDVFTREAIAASGVDPDELRNR